MKYRSFREYLDLKIAMGFLKLAEISVHLGSRELRDFFIGCGDKLADKYYRVKEIRGIHGELKSWEYVSKKEFKKLSKELNLIEENKNDL